MTADAVVASDCEQVERARGTAADGPGRQTAQRTAATSECARAKVSRLTVAAAKRRLKRAGCARRVTVRRAGRRRIKRGRVIRSIVRSGHVVLVVSRGRR